jgi:hypothetical protein
MNTSRVVFCYKYCCFSSSKVTFTEYESIYSNFATPFSKLTGFTVVTDPSP